jgi:phycobilisome core-membrane linker protein
VLPIVRFLNGILRTYIINAEFTALESKLSNAEITVKEFIEGLGGSDLYLKEFYAPYPNTKVIELGTKHFLGRAPSESKGNPEI